MAMTRTLERRSLRLKLAIGFSLILLITLAISIQGLLSERALVATVQKFHGEDIRELALGKEARIAHTYLRLGIRQAVLAREAAELDTSFRELDSSHSSLQKKIEELQASQLQPELRRHLSLFEENQALFQAGLDEAAALLRQNKQEEAQQFISTRRFQDPGIRASEALDRLIQGQEQEAEKNYREALELARHGQLRSEILLGLGMLLGLALWWSVARSISLPLDRLRLAVERLASGQLDLEVPLKEDGNEIGHLAQAISVLQSQAQELQAQRWVKSRVASLSAELQAAGDLAELTRLFLSRLATSLQFSQAAIYGFDQEQQQLRLLDSYACPAAESLKGQLTVGEGLIGQCAQELRPIVLTQPPTDYMRIFSGLGEASPRSIHILPVMRNERLLAVLELASLVSFSPSQRELLDGLLPTLATSLEIHERTAKTAQLLEDVTAAEERSRLILEAVGDGIVGLDARGMVTFANPAAPALLGYTLEEFVGRPLTEPMAHTARSGKACTVDDQVLEHKDGHSIPVEYSTTPVFKAGSLAGTVIVYRDIRERKLAEDRLQLANFLADIALELTDSGYWHVDYSDPDYYYQSERAARMLGEPIKSDGRYHLTDEWFSRLLEADREAANLTAERYQGAIDGRYDQYDSIYAYKRPVDGRIIWLHASGKLVRDPKTNKILFMYGAYQDITRQKQAEDKLRAATQS